MADIVIRDIPDVAAERLSDLAKSAGLNREAWLRQRLLEIADKGPVEVRWGHGLRAFTPDGMGKATLRQNIESVSGGGSNLTQEQFNAYQRAKLIADPRNGGNWGEAKRLLEEAGFEVFWD